MKPWAALTIFFILLGFALFRTVPITSYNPAPADLYPEMRARVSHPP